MHVLLLSVIVVAGSILFIVVKAIVSSKGNLIEALAASLVNATSVGKRGAGSIGFDGPPGCNHTNSAEYSGNSK
jgi:hypothetical protein